VVRPVGRKKHFLASDKYRLSNNNSLPIMFNRLFRPKWEHTDPRIRLEALESGDAPPEVLAKAVREDEDIAVRRCAAKRLEDIRLLSELIGSEPEQEVREAADQRRRELLAQPLEEGPSLEQRLQVMRDADSPGLRPFLACQARAMEIRAAALEQIEDTDILCVVAVEDPVAALRRQALERIQDPQGWETVARKAKKKDKQISRLARERFDAYVQRQSDEETAVGLCVEIEALAEATPKTGGRAGFMAVVTRWEKLASPLPAPLVERFTSARAVAQERIQRHEELLAERRAICEGLEDLLHRLQPGEGTESASPEEAGVELEQALERWNVLPPEAEDSHALTARFNDLTKRVQDELQRRLRDDARIIRLQGLLEKTQDLIDRPDELSERRIEGIRDQWSSLQQPESAPLAEALQQQFKTLHKVLREKLKRQISRRQHDLEEAEALIAELEQALQEGELKQALSLRDRARHRLKTAKGVDDRKRAALQEQLHRMHPRIEHLTKWRRWGDRDAREHLCGDIESLVDSVLSPGEIAARVRNARESWKRIDRAEGPAAEDLWHRFDQACTRAYAPYQEEQHQQAELRQAHLEQKRAILNELDEFERSTDWDNVDWREVDKQVRKARERWRRTGSVPRKGAKALERDYRRVIDRLETHLGGEREQELQRRRAVIVRMEELASASDLGAASREVKEAQRNWKPTVQAARRLEQELWQQFHTACDAIFQRLREEREAADNELHANLDRKTVLCQELEGLLGDGELKYRELAKRFSKAGGEWSEIGALPRNKEREMEVRFKALKSRLLERQQQELQAAAAAEMRGMQERVRLCECLEIEALEGSLTEDERRSLVEDSRQQWQRLPVVEPDQEKYLHGRTELAERALQGDAEARQSLLEALPGNLSRALDLCLRMEVEAGIDSPEEFADERMQLQVARLADALHHRLGEVDTGGDRLRRLQLDRFQLGLVPLQAREVLEARFERVMAALQAESGKHSAPHGERKQGA